MFRSPCPCWACTAPTRPLASVPVSLILSYERTARLPTRAVVTLADVAIDIVVFLVWVRCMNLPSMQAPLVFGVFARKMSVLSRRTVNVLVRCTLYCSLRLTDY